MGRSKTADNDGFYSQGASGMVLNQGTRGRVIKNAEEFPAKLRELCTTFVEKARVLDPTIPTMVFTAYLPFS